MTGRRQRPASIACSPATISNRRSRKPQPIPPSPPRSAPMPVHKEHKEFRSLDLTDGWQTPPGYPSGIEQKILSGHLDDQNKAGNRTRLLRFRPGAYTTAPFVHEYWEDAAI